MRRTVLITLIVCVTIHTYSNEYFSYSYLPELPANSSYNEQPGLAGVYTGIHNDALIVAGGANFPKTLPWEGGTKVYYNDIFVLPSKEASEWIRLKDTLLLHAAYGGAISTPHGVFCFGGHNSASKLFSTWFIKYNAESKAAEIVPGPKLPLAVTSFSYAQVDGVIYLAGGISEDGQAGKYFFQLNTQDDIENWHWEQLPPWPGSARALSVGVAQSNGVDNCFYLFSGRDVRPGADPVILYDAYFYNPKQKEWNLISDGTTTAFPFMAGTAFAVGANTIVFASGANGKQMMQEVDIKNDIALLQQAKECGQNVDERIAYLEKKLVTHLNNHKGFGNKLIGFNTITNEQFLIDSLLTSGQVTTNAVQWGSAYVIPSGEIKPGVRTPSVLEIQIEKEQGKLSMIDIVVIAIYFMLLAGMGYYFSKRQKNTDDYFKGGGRVPWWAAGLSIFGTALSAITFMAIPAKTFATDWSYFMLNMTIFLVAPVIVFLFIPYYRKLNITTAYEYLEQRYNVLIRLLGSVSFILFQIGRMGVVLFLPAIALNVVTGIDIYVCIALMGLVSLVYTIMGGIEAVIWTDVVQVIVLLGGAILSLVIVAFSIDGGLPEIVQIAVENNKFNVFDLQWSFTQPTVWVMLIGGVFANITTYGTDQTMVQRYLTTKSQTEANKSVWTNAILTIPASLLFFFVGTALFAFFKSNPTELNPVFANNDAIFPWYIISQLPSGIAGLLIAAIFAAAMSSLSSSLNSAATAYSTDIHLRFGFKTRKTDLVLARRATMIFGVVGILFAFFMASMDVKSLWDEFQKVLGLIIGSLGGVFLLGVLSKKANSTGVLIGIVCSIVVQVLVAIYQPVHLLLYAATGVVSCMVCGYLASLVFTTKEN